MKYRRRSKVTRSFAERTQCPVCKSKNKVIDALIINDEEVGYQTKCCKCGNVAVLYLDNINDNFYRHVASRLRHRKYGAVQYERCHHAPECRLYHKGQCRCGIPFLEHPRTRPYHHKDEDGRPIKIRQIENEKYR